MAAGARRGRSASVRAGGTTPKQTGKSKSKPKSRLSTEKKNPSPCIDLTAFGFSRTKRPAPVETSTCASATEHDVIVVGGGTTPSASRGMLDNDVVEIITSPTKRARKSTGSSSTTRASSNKIGAGKENPASAKGATTSIFSTASTTPAKNNTSTRSRRALSSATKSCAGSSGGSSSRVALLDLTQDSSSDSLDRKQPPRMAAKSTTSAASVVATAKVANTSTARSSAKTAKTLSGMAGALSNTILSASASTRQQRRGMRDKQVGQKRSGSMDAPISIFGDNDKTDTSPSAGKKARAKGPQKEATEAQKSPSLPEKYGEPKFSIGAVVSVQDRTWPGRNDQGGVAKIAKVHSADESGKGCIAYDVKYILESRREKGVEERFITMHGEYASPETTKNGRNGFATKRPPAMQPASASRAGKSATRGWESPGKSAASGARSPQRRKSSSPGKYALAGSSSASKGAGRTPRSQQKKSPSPSPGKYALAASSSASKGAGRARSPQKKSPQKVTNGRNKSRSSPQRGKQLARAGSIQSYFSAASPAKDDEKSSPKEVKTKAKVDSPTAANGKVRTKSSPSHPSSNYANALGLVSVSAPYQPQCTMAVVRAKADIFDPNSQPSSGDQPRRIFPGATLGRPSNKSRPNFVDLGIDSGAAGISRTHLKVLSVQGLVETTQASGNNSQQEMQFSSQTSMATSNSITTSSDSSSAPSMKIQVNENANSVFLYRTKHGARKEVILPPGGIMTLKIGDAIALHTNTKLHFCVVGLVYANNNNGEEDGAVGGAAVKEGGVEWNAGGGETVRTLEFTPPPDRNEKALPIERHVGSVTARKKRGAQGQPESAHKSVHPASRGSVGTQKTVEAIAIDDELDLSGKKKDPPEMAKPMLTDNDSKMLAEKDDDCKMPSKKVSTKKGKNGQKPLSDNTVALSQETSTTTKPDESVVMDEIMEIEENLTQDLFLGQAAAAVGRMALDAQEAIRDKITPSSPPAAVESSESKAKKEPQGESALIKKGDRVKVFFNEIDMFGFLLIAPYFGTVTSVKTKSNSPTPTFNIRIRFDGSTIESFSYPNKDVEKVVTKKDSDDFYPDSFVVGDVVDAKHQDKRWYRGRVANVNGVGNTCDVMYFDGEHESKIPTKQKNIRLIQRSNSGEWLVGRSAMLSRSHVDDKKSDHRSPQIGTVSKQLGDDHNYLVTFSDGSSESIAYEQAAKAAFAALPVSMQHEWPESTNSLSMVDKIRLRRQRKEQNNLIRAALITEEPEHTAKSSNARSNPSRYAPSTAAVKEETLRNEVCDSTEGDDQVLPQEFGPAIKPPILAKRKVAKDFPPGLPNMLWCALNSPEAQTGSNFLCDLLCAHDSVPPSTMVQKLMDLMKKGPKAEGSSVHFKDAHRTELAAQYVYGLLWASRRLVRRDSSAIFGPSSWDDIEVLMSQSIFETENMISGRRLAQGLQLAARGAKLLSMMLKTELQGHNLYSTSSAILDSTALKPMPTVRLVKSYGTRSGLKRAVEHMTKCLVRHSRWVMDSGGIELSPTASPSDECCSLEAKACLDNLGSAVCTIAWLLCVEDRINMKDPSVAFVIKDVLLVEMERALEDVPEMNARNKKKLDRKLKLYFLLSLIEDFATPLVVSLGNMIGVEDELAMVGLVA